MGDDEEDEASEDFLGWEGVYYYSRLRSSKTHYPSDLHTQSKDLSLPMLVMRDLCFGNEQASSLVFPPINHEGLHVSSSSHSNKNQRIHRSAPPQLPSVSPCNVDGNGTPSPLSRCLSFGLQILHSKVTGIASTLRNFAVTRGPFWAFQLTSGAVASLLLLLLLFVKVRRRQRQRHARISGEGKEELLLLIKEKDEKINQLLHQIARMNQVLLALHRVPSPNSD